MFRPEATRALDCALGFGGVSGGVFGMPSLNGRVAMLEENLLAYHVVLPGTFLHVLNESHGCNMC